jgi:hypothetical protein
MVVSIDSTFCDTDPLIPSSFFITMVPCCHGRGWGIYTSMWMASIESTEFCNIPTSHISGYPAW